MLLIFRHDSSGGEEHGFVAYVENLHHERGRAAKDSNHAGRVPRNDDRPHGKVREVFVIHVGGTRCVTSSTDHIMKIRARRTLIVEFIRTCIFLFLFDV